MTPFVSVCQHQEQASVLQKYTERVTEFRKQNSCVNKLFSLMMYEEEFYIPFDSISVISGRWKGKHEGLCAMKPSLDWERISSPAGFEPETL